MYTIGPFIAHVEEDHFEGGCDPYNSFMKEADIRFTGNTAEEAITKACEMLANGDDDAVERDACEEPGRVDLQVMETDDGMAADERDIAEWKQGKRRLWLVTYSAFMYRCEVESVANPDHFLN